MVKFISSTDEDYRSVVWHLKSIVSTSYPLSSLGDSTETISGNGKDSLADTDETHAIRTWQQRVNREQFGQCLL
jgi:hypothetical protein